MTRRRFLCAGEGGRAGRYVCGRRGLEDEEEEVSLRQVRAYPPHDLGSGGLPSLRARLDLLLSPWWRGSALPSSLNGRISLGVFLLLFG